MRSKDAELMERIHSYIDDYYLRNEEAPSTTDIAREFDISRSSAYRYLVSMAEKKIISYVGGTIKTSLMLKCNTNRFSAPLVGSVLCGDPTAEEEYIEEYVSLPESIFGSGEFFLLRARGDSMTDAGIEEGDLVLIKKTPIAEEGDIVVALDDENRNTLKRFGGYDEDGHIVLEYMNESVYPGKTILVNELTVQGVAKHVIKSL